MTGAAAQSDPLKDLDQAEAKWKAQGVKNYEFIAKVVCFCPPPMPAFAFRVTAGNGELTNSNDEMTRRNAEPYSTVEKLFAFLRDEAEKQPYRMVVNYHPELGYPISADLDRNRIAVDDEWLLSLTGFRTLD